MKVQFDLLSWVIGIPTGIGVNWLSQWLYHKLRKRQARGNYFTATYSSGSIDFEGRVKTHISAEDILDKLLESVTNKPNGGDKKELP